MIAQIARRKLPPIGKLEAARRQIEFAISAHFSDGDPFAVHTVISAAFGILRALAEKRGEVRIHTFLTDIIRPGRRSEFWSAMNRASNFLKHADRDADTMLEDISEDLNDSAIFMTIAYYGDLSGGTRSHSMDIFAAWYMCLHPNVMTDDFRALVLLRFPLEEVERLRQIPRNLQLAAGRALIENSKRQG